MFRRLLVRQVDFCVARPDRAQRPMGVVIINWNLPRPSSEALGRATLWINLTYYNNAVDFNSIQQFVRPEIFALALAWQG
jgi:hypothetical protein